MRFTVLTLFPELIEPYFQASIMSRAVEKRLISYRVVNIRDFASDRHRTCDDAPYGGGYGMVMKPEPLAAALDSVASDVSTTVFPTPSGVVFTQEQAARLANESELVFVCGRYEGIDQRIIDKYVHVQLSVGDYVLSSGEIATLTVIDAVYRLIEGVITAGSLVEESHNDSLLEYPHYTRPEVFEGQRVPEVLLSGNHDSIAGWRRWKQIERTMRVRPELFDQSGVTAAEVERLRAMFGGQDGSDKGDRS